MASITSPLTNQDMDRALGAVAEDIVQTVTRLRQTFDFWRQAISQENLDDGMLLTLGGPEAVPWSPALFQHYDYNLAQLNTLISVLTTGTPPPVEMVQAWSRQFR